MSGELEKLDSAVARWGELLDAESLSDGDVADLRSRLARLDLIADGRPICGVLRPHLITAGLLARQSQAADGVVAAARKVTGALLAGGSPGGGPVQSFRDWARRVLEMDADAAGEGSLTRLDAALARTRLHFLEINADTPLGVGHNDAIAGFFQELDTFARFTHDFDARPMLMEPPMLATVRTVWERLGGSGQPRVSIVTDTENPVITSSTTTDIESYRRHGLEAELVDYRDLMTSRGRLHGPGGAIELVHRIMPIAQCLANRVELQPLLEAARSGSVRMLNPFRSELLGHKVIFALLSDPNHQRVLDASERAAVRDHVPWGRPLEDGAATDPDGNPVDLVPYVLENRARLALKPSHSYGGRDVHLGWREADADWERLVATALEDEYIVQHRVELHRHPYPTLDSGGQTEDYYEDTDPFLFDGRLGGMLSRLSPTEITNVHAGGSVVPTFVIEGRR